MKEPIDLDSVAASKRSRGIIPSPDDERILDLSAPTEAPDTALVALEEIAGFDFVMAADASGVDAAFNAITDIAKAALDAQLYGRDRRASADTLPKGQDAQQGLAGTESGAVPPVEAADAQGTAHEK